MSSLLFLKWTILSFFFLKNVSRNGDLKLCKQYYGVWKLAKYDIYS